jgi:hypothetical protein
LELLVVAGQCLCVIVEVSFGVVVPDFLLVASVVSDQAQLLALVWDLFDWLAWGFLRTCEL